MKKFFVMVVAAMMAAVSVSAQNDEANEISVFYGFGSASNIVSDLGSAFTYSTGDQTGFWGPIGLEYYRHLTNVVAVGIVAEYAGCKWDRPYEVDGSLNSTYLTAMPSVKFNWLRKKNFGLYSSLSAGIMVADLGASGSITKDPEVKNAEETVTSFMFNINPIGAEFGGAFRGFVELGFGEKGLLCAGLRYKF